MSNSDRLIIISIVVSFITPLAAAVISPVVTARLSRPKSADPVKLNNPSQTSGGPLIGFLKSNWLPLLSIGLNVCILPYQVRNARPVTGQSVFLISSAVGAIFLNLAMIMMSALARLTGKIIDQQGEQIRVIGQMLEHEGVLIDRVKRLESKEV